MKIYKVYLDMTLVISSLKKYRIYEYNAEFPIVFVEAKNPDGACYKVIFRLITMLLRQDGSEEGVDLCRRIPEDIRVIKVHSP
tara:strand:- start:589 stop:837 length:249 start_codon:yes stop_codon:yes gene_type:complete